MATSERTALTVVNRGTGEIVQEHGTALAPRRPAPGLIRPVANPGEVLQAQEETRRVLAEVLQDGRDYGKIPGVDKPSMLKPGAERSQIAFGCYTRFVLLEQEIDHERAVPWVKRKKKWGERRGEFTWEEEHGTALGLYRYVFRAEVVHRDSDTVVGSCIGTCSTLESKYCDRPRDSENTVAKMAQKRAMVGATLHAFGLSDQFTQDVEENPDLYRGAAGADAGSAEEYPVCPKCSGPMWDNREKKASGEMKPNAPDFKCKRKGQCDGVLWPGDWPPEPAQADAEPARHHPTPAQEEFVLNMIASHVFTDEERAVIERNLERGFKGPVSEAIDGIKAQLDSRKKAEAEASTVDAEVIPDTPDEEGDDHELPF